MYTSPGRGPAALDGSSSALALQRAAADATTFGTQRRRGAAARISAGHAAAVRIAVSSVEHACQDSLSRPVAASQQTASGSTSAVHAAASDRDGQGGAAEPAGHDALRSCNSLTPWQLSLAVR
jgi:hypothetical protein